MTMWYQYIFNISQRKLLARLAGIRGHIYRTKTKMINCWSKQSDDMMDVKNKQCSNNNQIDCPSKQRYKLILDD